MSFSTLYYTVCYILFVLSELKKKEADRTQLIINNKKILKGQEYTINLLIKERQDVEKNLGNSFI